MFRISKRYLETSKWAVLEKKNQGRRSRKGLQPSQFWTSHILLNQKHRFMIPGETSEEFRWWLGMLVWSMPAMFWAKICQHSSWSFFMEKTMGLLDSTLKSGYFLTSSLLWDKPWWFFSNRCIGRLQSHLEIAIDQKIGTGRVSFLSLFRRLVVSHLKVKIDGICRD